MQRGVGIKKQKMEKEKRLRDIVGTGLKLEQKKFQKSAKDKAKKPCQTRYLNGLYSILILVLCILFSSTYLLFPLHNSIIFPEYWYETLFTAPSGFFLTLTFDAMLVCKFYFKLDCMLSFGTFTKLYLAPVIPWVTITILSHYIWTDYFGYNHPMPFTLLLGYFTPFIQAFALYLLLPQKFSTRENFQKRIRAYTFSRIWVIFIACQYQGFTFLFTVLPLEMQWVVALLLPILREFNYRVVNYIMIESADVEDGSGKITIIIGNNGFHALYVAIQLAQNSTVMTSYCILATDFILNLYSCHKIIQLHRAIASEPLMNLVLPNAVRVTNKDEQLLKLILIETLEILIPLAYILTVLIAYYGPNAEIIGNIRNNYWQYESIDDIGTVVEAVSLMFAIDLCSAIIAGLLLWKMCSINILREFCRIMDEYWTIIAINIANYLNYVSTSSFFLFKSYVDLL